MDYQHVLFEKEDGIGIVTINRQEALNALNDTVEKELYEQFDYPRITKSSSLSPFHQFSGKHITIIGDFTIFVKLSGEALRSIRSVMSDKHATVKRLQLSTMLPRQKTKLTVQVKYAPKTARKFIKQFKEYFG